MQEIHTGMTYLTPVETLGMLPSKAPLSLTNCMIPKVC